MEAGIVTSLLSGCTIFARTKYKLAVFEIDERSSKRIYPYVKPELIAITNLFRDSIMRNAHPEYIAGIIEESIPECSKLILNGDDLISSESRREMNASASVLTKGQVMSRNASILSRYADLSKLPWNTPL